jgi:uncharacterized protein (TIGR00299 family) protein
MRIGYIECFSGISGDMLLAALIHAGVPLKLLEDSVAALNIGATLRLTRVDRSGIYSAKIDVLVDGHPAEEAGCHSHPDNGEAQNRDHHAHATPAAAHSHEHIHSHDGQTHSHAHTHAADEPPHAHDHAHDHDHVHGRNWPQIRAIIEQAALSPRATGLALRAFELLAQTEARIHNVPVETIHFHEVGAVDAIVDIVCNAVGLTHLDVDRWVCSPINTGSGFVECAHGRFPVPAPATAALLIGAPTYSSGIEMELATPTGAALLRALGCDFGDAPAMRASSIGYGAGSKNPKRFPNVVRLTLGESSGSLDRSQIGASGNSLGSFPTETITVLECAVDDMHPQLIAHAMELVLDHGALDVMAVPVLMKKNRMGTLLTVLCRPENDLSLQQLLFRETTTLGIRVRSENRVFLDRKQVTVDTVYGELRVKVGTLKGEQWNAMPEYDDCASAAARHGVPIKLVMQAALAALSVDDSLNRRPAKAQA